MSDDEFDNMTNYGGLPNIPTKPSRHRKPPLYYFILAIGLAAITAVASHRLTKSMLAEDCTNLNMTIVDGQWYICKPHNPKPKRMM